MRAPDDGRSGEEVAAFAAALAHPARVAAMRTLRERRRMPVAELRRRVAEATGAPLDARGVRFHLRRMQEAGLLVVVREERRDVAVLLRDVALRVRPVA